MAGELALLEATRKRLDEVSSCFCLAKWLQVTLHLYNGHTHSCHHPDTHKVPREKLSEDPSVLHNTEYKKKMRAEMLSGVRPPECQYCWTVEDSAGRPFSDRHIKSNDEWASPYLDQIATGDPSASVLPTYVEVSFSNACNFKCRYCGPNVSSAWMKDIQENGPYPTGSAGITLEALAAKGKLPYPPEAHNPYVDAFWKWWPELFPRLHVFRITGGEPLLSNDTFEILKFLTRNRSPSLEFAVNSNLGVPLPLIDKFLGFAQTIVNEQRIKSFSVYTSVDNFGKRAEYIRTGLDFEKFIANIEYLLERMPSLQIVIMCTYNALSVVGFDKLLDEVIRIRQKYAIGQRGKAALILDVSYLRNPKYLAVTSLSADYIDLHRRNVEYMRTLGENVIGPNVGFYDYEIAKLERITNIMVDACEERASIYKEHFFRFIQESDRRLGTDFLSVFPEMGGFYRLCQNAAENPEHS